MADNKKNAVVVAGGIGLACTATLIEKLEFPIVVHGTQTENKLLFKERFPNVTIIGAIIDVSRELLNGTPQDVENKVKENITNLAASGRYIVGPICCLPWGVSLKNIMSIFSFGKKFVTLHSIANCT